MQTKFVEIRGFFDEKIANVCSAGIYCQNSWKFAVAVFTLANFQTSDLLASKIDFKSSSKNSSCSINDFKSLSEFFALFSLFSKFYFPFP